MNDPTLKCPKCGAEVPLTEGIAAPMVAAVRTEMQADLEAERRAMTRAWAKRAAQIDAVMGSTTGLFGDLQATATLPEIAALSMAALGSGE